MEFAHKPVMLRECLDALNVQSDGIYLDCTIGGGGHSREILKRLKEGKLIGIDKDSDALSHCAEELGGYQNLILQKADFKDAVIVLERLGIDRVDGILMDLGISSFQIDNKQRGFSYMEKDALLDMRMDVSQRLSAYDVVNDYSEGELARILTEYGEEKFAKRIARNIVLKRVNDNIKTAGELVEIIDASLPAAVKRTGGHPAKRTFQAIRIEVNGELEGLSECITSLTRRLNKGGRMAVLTFHSLEDRIVKQTFKELEIDCICPPKTPICICNKKSEVKILTRKPILPSEEEMEENSRSKSAKLRAVEKK
ncbi:MAG: 16S rRNA (cytosine(1402)-N(4))-methyltransferase RsmH [Clostridia bacterium]|nr:16S rRNA (cytosine(1402)-N(4))-methyltransferase RsmH [Clostridia bacterium]